METLADSVQIVAESLPPILVGDSAREWIRTVAGRLAPIHCAGFEVRLENDPTVDMIHRVRGAGGEPQRLRRYILDGELAESETWLRVAALCEVWSHPASVIDRTLTAMFLSFDANPAADETPAPSVYLSLEPGAGAQWPRFSEFLESAACLLRGAPLSDELLDVVRTCHQALPKGAAIADAGFMLSREADAARLVVAHLERDQIGDYLDRLDWETARPDVDGALALIPAGISHLIVSLDLGEYVYPKLGLEFDPGPLEQAAGAWATALDALVQAQLCLPAKRDALLSWPGYTEPTETSNRWPDRLLLSSLLNRSDQFIVMARRLAFLKLVCDANAGIEAKVYFGYGPRSFVTESDGVIADAVRVGVPTSTEVLPTQSALTDAVLRGARYLTEHCRPDSLWLEFPRVLRGTDEWITAYVAHSLASLADDTAQRAARRSWAALSSIRAPDEGWGYNGSLPQDADSTLWGLRLATALGLDESARAAAATEVLRRHMREDGGVATYEGAAEPELRQHLGDLDIKGMFAPHVCVTAAAAAVPSVRSSVTPFLIEHQEADGRWRGYWWSDDEYTTALAVESLTGSTSDAARQAIAAAAEWAASRFDRNGQVWSRELAAPSAFATALVIEVLLLTRPSWTSLRRPMASLLATQESDGSWPRSALMRMPFPAVSDGDARPEATTVSFDDRALFTTATVVRVLNRARALP